MEKITVLYAKLYCLVDVAARVCGSETAVDIQTE